MIAWCMAVALAAPGDLLEPDAELLWMSTGKGDYGWEADQLGDLDGDGANDVVVGAPQGGDGGRIVVLSGRTGVELFRVAGEPGQALGTSVDGAGDVDADGIEDVISGAASGRGRVVVVSGADGSILLDFAGEVNGERLGDQVAGLGDVDGDGHSDVAAGAPQHTDGGRVLVWSGATGAVLQDIRAPAPNIDFGWGVHRVDDLDGDGAPDIAIGASDHGANAEGALFVYSSGTGEQLLGPMFGPPGGWDLGRFFVGSPGDVTGDGKAEIFGGDFSANSGNGRIFLFDGASGSIVWMVEGRNGEGLGCGRQAGDFDRDGVPDVAVGSWKYAGEVVDGGRVTVFSGVDGSVIRRWTSLEPGENFGFDAVGLGDVDGDGGIDILTTAATENRVYVVRGIPVPEDPAEPEADDETGCGCDSSGGFGGWVLVPLLVAQRRRATRRSLERGASRTADGGIP